MSEDEPVQPIGEGRKITVEVKRAPEDKTPIDDEIKRKAESYDALQSGMATSLNEKYNCELFTGLPLEKQKELDELLAAQQTQQTGEQQTSRSTGSVPLNAARSPASEVLTKRFDSAAEMLDAANLASKTDVDLSRRMDKLFVDALRSHGSGQVSAPVPPAGRYAPTWDINGNVWLVDEKQAQTMNPELIQERIRRGFYKRM